MKIFLTALAFGAASAAAQPAGCDSRRMVFTDVKADAFKWLWQRSDDGGATWKTTWEIDYRRVK